MSRYSTTTKEFTYAWGYDQAMSTYFFQKFLNEPEEDEEECLFSIDSYYTTQPHPDYPKRLTFPNSLILEIMESEEVEIPEEHLDAIAMDLPY